MGNDDLDDRSPSFHYSPRFLVIQSAVREKVVENEGLKKS
ncbi:hypothetical protein CU024_0725 [Enterococcus faecium]|nr:hypothetical protein [Enterococcus faecium]MBK4808061.1 hypothetical protein [Enterococcus faecium]